MEADTESKEAQTQNKAKKEPETTESEDEILNGDENLQISVQGNGHTIVFELNDSPASRSLYDHSPHGGISLCIMERMVLTVDYMTYEVKK